jgi:hypothetical protein
MVDGRRMQMPGISENWDTKDAWRWRLALAGQFLFVFTILILSGPGRIDIVDGQTRYEVARSLIDHGDSIIRDSETWFAVYEGRDGEKYTNYRFPQTGAGLLAILAADATGPVCEMRRQFFFTLISPFAAAILALTYSVWFRHLGFGPGASLVWATAGIFCTPSWFYGTSTFDDMLGTTGVVLAVAVSWMCRDKRPFLGAVLSGLLLGWAVNCKPPLGFFVLPVLAAGYRPQTNFRRQLLPAGIVLAGIALGVVAFKLYDWYKFPPGATEPFETYVQLYGDIWTWNPIPGLVNLALSPTAGIIWYAPTIVLSFYGWRRWQATWARFCLATLAACGLFTLFISFLPFFKGEPAWGPRYLTPVVALAWVFVPAAAQLKRRLVIGLILGAGMIVQLLALSMDPQRLFFETPLPINYYNEHPWLGFHPATSHLVQRPGDIIRTLRAGQEHAPHFATAPLPTHAGKFVTPFVAHLTSSVGVIAIPQGTVSPIAFMWDFRFGSGQRAKWMYQEAFRQNHIMQTFRPWWASQWYLPEDQRPVDLVRTLLLLGILTVVGLGVMVISIRAVFCSAAGIDRPSRRQYAVAAPGP